MNNLFNLVTSCLLILMISLIAACGSGSSRDATPTPTVEETFQQKLDTLVNNSTIPGAIALLSKSSEIWVAASGFSNIEDQISIATTSQMRIASMTKPMVSVTMLKLIEEGYFDLEDNIMPFLSDQLNQGLPNTQRISIKHLLSMQSGIKDYTESVNFNESVEETPQKKWTANEVLSFLIDQPANFEPGASWEYSNSNYVLCDLIVENATGLSLAYHMRRIIFEPLAMNSTYMEIQELSSADGLSLTARGYDGDEDVTEINDGLGLGDGGVVSTVSDMNLFLTKLFRDKLILNDQSLEQMLDSHPVEDYGLGIEKRSVSFGIAFAHSGGSSGFGGDMMYIPEEDITWVFLSNQLDDNDVDVFESLSMVLSN